VEQRADFVARVSGIQRCGSPWSCPVCAPVVRERKAQEIEAGLVPFLGLDRSFTGRNAPQSLAEDPRGSALWVTLTARHFRRDSLASRLDVMSRAMGLCLNGEPWKRRAARLSYAGLIRALEVTYGRNGWHPHVHAVLLFDRELSAGELAEFEDWLYRRWSGVLAKRRLGSITKRNGVDVRRVVAAEGLSAYMAKVEDGWGVGLELARADLKAGRRSGSIKPVQLLANFAETGDADQLALWLEYEAATFGKRAIVWSRGLRGRLGLDAEASDVELAASEGDGPGEVLLTVLVAHAVWNRHVKAGTTGDLLTRIEGMASGGLRGVHQWPEEGS